MDALRREVVVDPSGRVRQAGATTPEGAWCEQLRESAEGSLYVFAIKGWLR